MINKIIECKTITHKSDIKENNIKNKSDKNNLIIDTNNKITNSTEYFTKNNKTETNEDNYIKNRKNIFPNVTNVTTGNNFHKRNFILNIRNTPKKDIEIWKSKLITLIHKYKEVIPENTIYSSLIDIIHALK